MFKYYVVYKFTRNVSPEVRDYEDGVFSTNLEANTEEGMRELMGIIREQENAEIPREDRLNDGMTVTHVFILNLIPLKA